MLVDNWDVDGYLKEIVYRVCANLNGSHSVEKKTLDPIIYTTVKEREKVRIMKNRIKYQDVEIIRVSLDLILIITKYQNGRELLRKANVYYVVRDMHAGKQQLLRMNNRIR